MKITSTLERFENNMAYTHYIHVPKKIGDQLCDGDNRRVLCELNAQKSIQTALMPYPNGFYLLINQKIITELNLRIGDEVRLDIRKDESEYGMPMPEELFTLLDQDAEGNKYFHDLTPGKQRNLIYIINQVKNTDNRLIKALAIVDHLKEKMGKLDFKELNQKIKAYNQLRKLKK